MECEGYAKWDVEADNGKGHQTSLGRSQVMLREGCLIDTPGIELSILWICLAMPTERYVDEHR